MSMKMARPHFKSLAKSTSSLGALAMGLEGTDWELDFKQFSFYHIMQVLRVCSCSTFALPPALPPCCCPLAFQRQVRRLASRISSESYPGSPECVVSCHGADRMTNSIRAISGHLSGRKASTIQRWNGRWPPPPAPCRQSPQQNRHGQRARERGAAHAQYGHAGQ